MKVEHIRPFAEASVEICATLLGESPERGDLSVRSFLQTSQQVNVVCGIGGSVRGHVMLGMSARTASRIASRMIGSPVVTFDLHAASAIAEFTNMIGGRSLTLFEADGFICSLTPPTVIRGAQANVGGSGPVIAIPFILQRYGEIEIQVGLDAASQAA